VRLARLERSIDAEVSFVEKDGIEVKRELTAVVNRVSHSTSILLAYVSKMLVLWLIQTKIAVCSKTA
jgi:hypothetical protein